MDMVFLYCRLSYELVGAPSRFVRNLGGMFYFFAEGGGYRGMDVVFERIWT